MKFFDKRLSKMTGSIRYQVDRIWYQIDGIGKSKKDSRKATENKGQNGHYVSEYVHSTALKKEVINRAKELGKFARERFNVKDMQAITNEIID